MFIKKSSLGRAVFLAAQVSFLSLGFISCQPETEIKYVEKEVEKLVEKEVEKLVDKIVTVPVFHLSEDDLICGNFVGDAGNFWIYPDYVFNQSVATISECAKEDAVYSFTLASWYQDENGEWKETSTNYYFKDDGNPAYVVYNDEDHLAGVLIFKTKYSAWGTPTEGCYYGIKFQFDKDDDSKVLIEGGYSSDSAYNNVNDLAEAVEMFAFDNDDYYNPEYWNEVGSGATRAIE